MIHYKVLHSASSETLEQSESMRHMRIYFAIPAVLSHHGLIIITQYLISDLRDADSSGKVMELFETTEGNRETQEKDTIPHLLLHAWL